MTTGTRWCLTAAVVMVVAVSVVGSDTDQVTIEAKVSSYKTNSNPVMTDMMLCVMFDSTKLEIISPTNLAGRSLSVLTKRLPSDHFLTRTGCVFTVSLLTNRLSAAWLTIEDFTTVEGRSEKQ